MPDIDLPTPGANPNQWGTMLNTAITVVNNAVDEKVGSPNTSVTGVEHYPSVADLPLVGTVGVIYFTDAE